MASNLLVKLGDRLFDDKAEAEAFVAAIEAAQAGDRALLWLKDPPNPRPFAVLPPLPWQPDWCDRLDPAEKPGKHPLHDQGAYYCLDFSSVFSASVLLVIPEPMPFVLDLCSAPGGKGLFAWRLLQPDTLWCNEAIRKRVKILIANLKRCGAYSAQVFNLDPQVFAEGVPSSASLVIVDAPCSGQSLIAKGGKAEGCFHKVTINKNANRQKRIIAHAAQTVAGGGYLAYMTCTFSRAENEQVGDWLLRKFPQFEPVAVPHLAGYQSHLGSYPCYRLWPQSGLGAGAFAALFRNGDTATQPVNSAFIDQYAMTLERS